MTPLSHHGANVAAQHGSPVVLLRDTFTDTDATALAAHTMDVGAGWTVHAGTWVVSGNRATKTASNNTHQTASADAGQADVTAQTTFTTGTSGGLAARLTDNSNFWGLELAPGGGGTLKLYENNAGSFTTRASAFPPVTGGQSYELRLSMAGTSLTAFLGGITRFAYSSAFNQGATRHGLWIYGTAEAHDDFQVATP